MPESSSKNIQLGIVYFIQDNLLHFIQDVALFHVWFKLTKYFQKIDEYTQLHDVEF